MWVVTDLYEQHVLAACLKLSSVYMCVVGWRGWACSHSSAFMVTCSHSSCQLEYFSSITASANMAASPQLLNRGGGGAVHIGHFIFRSATEKPGILLSLLQCDQLGTMERRTVRGYGNNLPCMRQFRNLITPAELLPRFSKLGACILLWKWNFCSW